MATRREVTDAMTDAELQARGELYGGSPLEYGRLLNRVEQLRHQLHNGIYVELKLLTLTTSPEAIGQAYVQIELTGHDTDPVREDLGRAYEEAERVADEFRDWVAATLVENTFLSLECVPLATRQDDAGWCASGFVRYWLVGHREKMIEHGCALTAAMIRVLESRGYAVELKSDYPVEREVRDARP